MCAAHGAELVKPNAPNSFVARMVAEKPPVPVIRSGSNVLDCAEARSGMMPAAVTRGAAGGPPWNGDQFAPTIARSAQCPDVRERQAWRRR